MSRIFFLSLLCLTRVSFASTESRSPDYRSTTDQKVETFITEIRSQKDEKLRLAKLKELQSFLSQEKTRVRVALQSAKLANSKKADSVSSSQLQDLDGQDTEILILWYTMDPVFEAVLEPKFTTDKKLKQQSCKQVRTETNQLNDAPASDVSNAQAVKLALEIVSAFCD